MATVAASKEGTAGNAPGASQLPPFKQAWPILWYKQAESLMDLPKIKMEFIYFYFLYLFRFISTLTTIGSNT